MEYQVDSRMRSGDPHTGKMTGLLRPFAGIVAQ